MHRKVLAKWKRVYIILCEFLNSYYAIPKQLNWSDNENNLHVSSDRIIELFTIV